MAEIVHYKREPEKRPKGLLTGKPNRRRQPDRRQAPRRRSDRPRTLLIALVGLSIGAYAALGLRTANLSGVEVKGRFALCGNGVWRDCVIDGDTIRFQGATIRVADINAPEIQGAKCAAERHLGRQATLRLRALLNAGPFQLAPAGGPDTDKYGRKLRLIRRDGRSLGEALVAEGLARPWTGRRRDWCE